MLLPAAAGWLSAFLDEVSSFPSAPHDDQVDAMSQALAYLHHNSWSAQDSEIWQQVGAQQLAASAQRRRLAGYTPGTMINNVADADAAEYGGTAVVDGKRYTNSSRLKGRWGGF